MKSIALLLFISISSWTFSQGFYDIGTIQKIEITFTQSNWDALLDAEKAGSENYIMAKSVAINGTAFDSVGVKYKGNSTYKANQTKNPFHIELNTYKDQDYEGYKDIKLSNVANDPSFVREPLSYQILRQYMDAPLSNYANVYVNGTLIGLYCSSEAISKVFVNTHFYSKNNSFFKCNPIAGAGPGTTDKPNLVYLGADSASYYASYEMKSDIGWFDLLDLCNKLKNNTALIESVLDVDRAIWMLAFDNALVNLDSYIGGFAQNYYLYKDDNGRFVPVVWDLNESFGRFSMTGSGSLNSTKAKQEMDHLININDANYPLNSKLLAVPMYKRMYLAHLKTIMQENFANNSYFTSGTSMQATVDAAVQADGNKFFTYANFKSNLSTDIMGGGGPGGGATPGIKSLMDGRSTYLLGLSDFTKTEPTISDVLSSNTAPKVNESIFITAKITNATKVYLGYRYNKKTSFKRIEMYDDGTHGDGATGDGTYGVSLDVNSSLIQYYIYAENNDIGKFSPVRAEHEFHELIATTTTPVVSDLVINELMASNTSNKADQDGEYDDWIELYNNSAASIDLTGYYLSDNSTNLTKWAFPSGTTIGSKEYLIIWADNDITQQGLHASFKLSATEESLYLINASNKIIDEVDFSNQTTDISYGRYPNGTGAFQTMVPTHKAQNIGIATGSINTEDEGKISIYPNPSSNGFFVKLNSTDSESESVEVYSIAGSIIYSQAATKDTYIDTKNWARGIYILKIGSNHSKIVLN